ncbi:asparagine synthase-related protein [Cryobacterium sp. SO2]|uniref:asparagine synthase-related protein n=1 Tax=Cryobacterium sp. SO2 TaxID=1897060 RepID=UPI00223CC041|nr:asparagine synthase-related protein [Cryobacterium sp. SO2]WEO78733.1 asparagine synthase-related protein [Cryobacterium sp. SO2]
MALTFLQDSPHSERVLAELSHGTGMSTVRHASGNEWVIGRLTEHLVLTSRDRRAVLVIERCGITNPHRLQNSLNDISDLVAAHDFLAEIAGDGIVAISFDGHQLLAGSLSGSSNIHWVTSNDGTVASDSALTLAKAHRAKVSLPRLALRLNRELPPYPFALLPLWDQVDRLHPHSYLALSPNGGPRAVCWWTPPAVGDTLDEGADRVRKSLTETLGQALDRSDTVTCDLSGGLDSSSVAYALGSLGATPTAFHSRSVNPRNDDLSWARKAADDLSIELRELPTLGSTAQAFLLNRSPSALVVPDQPILWSGSNGFLQKLRRSLSDFGQTTHFTGIGGDELFGPVPAISWSLVNEGGLHSVAAVRRLCSASRTPFLPVLAEVVNRQTFGSSLAALPSKLAHRANSSHRPGSWFARPSWPENMTTHATDLAATALAFHGSSPWRAGLDPDRGRHQMHESLLFQGQVQHQINQVHGGNARWDSPFLKRSMIEAVSAVPMRYRLGTSTAKPLLARAMAPLSMPPEFFKRRVSGEYSADTYAEFTQRRTELHTGIRASLLAEANLIDVDLMLSRLSDPAPSPDFLSQVETFVAVENWLQAATRHGVGI